MEEKGSPGIEAFLAMLAAGETVTDELDLDALDSADRMEVAVALRRHLDRQEAQLARVLAALDDRGDWAVTGAPSLATWLSRRTGAQPGRVRASAELGRAMAACPALDEAVRSGRVTPGAASAVVPAMSDDGFADAAESLVGELVGMTPTQAARHVESWRAIADPPDDQARRRSAHERRFIRFRPAGDGMEQVEGLLPSDTCRALRLALAHLTEQQRSDGSDRTPRQRSADALGDLAAAFGRGEVSGGRDLPRLIVTMTLGDLEQRGAGRAATGEVITSSEIDRMCCDAVIHRYVADQDGAVLNFGRGRRTVSPQQFLALVARDGGCRGPSCDRPPGWCEAHHVREYAARRGLTNIDELVLLCHHHHHLVHEGGWTMTGDPTHLVLTGPDGQVHHSFLPRHDTAMAA